MRVAPGDSFAVRRSGLEHRVVCRDIMAPGCRSMSAVIAAESEGRQCMAVEMNPGIVEKGKR